jgi:uncharacterized protein YbcV (DUF1398 family)
MKSEIKQVVEQCAHDSYAGTISFGEVVQRLMRVGVESYRADYRVPSTTYYKPNGDTYTVALHAPDVEIAQDFNAPAVQSAIRGAQSGEVKYPEFLIQTMAAGCIGYMVWIAGRHVTYFGRCGEMHVEKFPNSN